MQAIANHKKSFLDVLWGCQMKYVQWMMCECCGCLQFISKQHGEISSMNLICMKASNFTSLETRATPCILHNQKMSLTLYFGDIIQQVAF